MKITKLWSAALKWLKDNPWSTPLRSGQLIVFGRTHYSFEDPGLFGYEHTLQEQFRLQWLDYAEISCGILLTNKPTRVELMKDRKFWLLPVALTMKNGDMRKVWFLEDDLEKITRPNNAS